MSDWRMAIQMAAAESAQRIAALEAENARLQGAIFAHHERYDQLKLWCDGEIEQHHMLTADVQRLRGELEQARLKHEQDQATISLLERNWYTCTEERDNARQQLAEAQAKVKACGGDNCIGQRIAGVATWVREERLLEAQAEVVRLREALEEIKVSGAGCTDAGCDGRGAERMHSNACPVWFSEKAEQALLATTSPAVSSVEQRLKAADELADAAGEVDQHAPIAPEWAYNLRRKLVAYRAASGEE